MSCIEYNEPEYGPAMWHNLMLSDKVRTGAYAKAIMDNIKEGDVVVDVGAGTGIFSLLAAKLGARVYAIEPTEIIEVAKQNAKRNGVEDKITFIKCLAEEAEIPEEVDCIVSEWMGVMVLQENMLPAVTSIRDRYLKPHGKILPEKISIYLGLVSSERIHNETIGRWEKPFFGLDYSYFRDYNTKDTHLITAEPSEMGSSPVKIMEINVRTINPKKLYEMTSKLIANDNMVCQGILGWFKADFPGGITLDTSPYVPSTHWQQLYFPFENTAKLTKNDLINFSLKIEEDDNVPKLMHFSWKYETNGE